MDLNIVQALVRHDTHLTFPINNDVLYINN